MTALSKDRNTAKRSAELRSLQMAAVVIYAGSLVCINSSGYATPGATATTLKAVGRANETVDNSAGNAGDKSVEVESGVFLFANSSAGDLITRAEIGSNCYIVDDQTVAKTDGSSSRSVAGVVFDVDSDGVWVKIG